MRRAGRPARSFLARSIAVTYATRRICEAYTYTYRPRYRRNLVCPHHRTRAFSFLPHSYRARRYVNLFPPRQTNNRGIRPHIYQHAAYIYSSRAPIPSVNCGRIWRDAITVCCSVCARVFVAAVVYLCFASVFASIASSSSSIIIITPPCQYLLAAAFVYAASSRKLFAFHT